MAATLSLDTITSSGTNIEIPTGKVLKIADAGALKINNIAITTGAQGVISKTATYPIVSGDFTGKTSLIVLIDVSAGTSTETIITLPAEADFSTCAIHVISTATHGAGNKITIKNDSPAEVYTLYCKNDHCEFVSDGTTVFRTGNEYVTIKGQVTLNSDQTMPGNTFIDVCDYFGSAQWVVREDTASWWNTTDADLDIPAGYRIFFGGPLLVSEYGAGYQIRDGDAGNYLTAYMDSSYHYNVTAGVSNFVLDFPVAKTVTFWGRNFTGANHTAQGASGPNYVSQIRWDVVRRL